MRNLTVLVLGLGMMASSAQAMTPLVLPGPAGTPSLAVTKIEYFCSPGFVPTYGGRCVATEANDEVELFLNEPVEAPVVHHHRRHHGRHARY